MAKKRKRHRLAKRWLHKLNKKVAAMRRRRAREAQTAAVEAEINEKVALLRAEQRRLARKALDQLGPYKVSEVAADRLQWASNWSSRLCFIMLAPCMLAIVLHQAGIVDITKYVALAAAVANLVLALAATAASLFVHRQTRRELVGSWMMLGSVGFGALTYGATQSLLDGAVVMTVCFLAGVGIGLWGVAYQTRLVRLAGAK